MGSMVHELQASLEPISCSTIVEGQEVHCRIGQPYQPAFNSKDGGGGEAGRCGAELVQGCGGSGLAGTPTQVATPPLTMLTHVSEAREVGGGARRGVCQLISSLPGWLACDPSGGGGGVARG
jgi:hypothetical protein